MFWRAVFTRILINMGPMRVCMSMMACKSEWPCPQLSQLTVLQQPPVHLIVCAPSPCNANAPLQCLSPSTSKTPFPLDACSPRSSVPVWQKNLYTQCRVSLGTWCCTECTGLDCTGALGCIVAMSCHVHLCALRLCHVMCSIMAESCDV